MKGSVVLLVAITLVLGGCGQEHPYRHRNDCCPITTDDAIAEKVKRTLHHDHSLSESGRTVNVTVQNGVVYLHGCVCSEKEKARITDIARHVNGVKWVTNNLKVK